MNSLVELTEEIKSEITCTEDLIKVNVVLKKAIEHKKIIEDKLDPEIANAYKTHKGLTALKKEQVSPWQALIDRSNLLLKNWTLKKEEEAKALQNKINAELAIKAEEEKQRLLKESEGKDEWSKEIAQEKIQEIKPVTVELKDCKETIAPKQEGQYKRSNWKAKVIDESLVPEGYWIINEKALDEVAKKEKGQLKVPGVEFYDDFTIVTKI